MDIENKEEFIKELIVGYAKIIKIFNKLLDKNSAGGQSFLPTLVSINGGQEKLPTLLFLSRVKLVAIP